MKIKKCHTRIVEPPSFDIRLKYRINLAMACRVVVKMHKKQMVNLLVMTKNKKNVDKDRDYW